MSTSVTCSVVTQLCVRCNVAIVIQWLLIYVWDAMLQLGSVITHLCVRCKVEIAVLQLWRYNITIAVWLVCRSSMLFVFGGLACDPGWPWTLSSPRAGIAGLIHHTSRGRWLRSTIKKISSVSRSTLAGCRIKTYQKGTRLNYQFALSGVSLFCLLGRVLHIYYAFK